MRRRPVSPATPAGRPRLLRGAARSLLATPWFAAGTGFVIAAGLWVYAPHAVLTFPSTTPFDVPCVGQGCHSQGTADGSGRLAVSTPGQRMVQPKAHQHWATSAGSDQHGAATPIVVKFELLRQRQDTFYALITASGQQVPVNWTLTFEMPGTQIGTVLGATWKLSTAGDGGTASPPSDQSSADAHDISIVITGSGTANMPIDCVFDGGSCSFVTVSAS